MNSHRIHAVRLSLPHQCELLRLLRPIVAASASELDVRLFALVSAEPDQSADACVVDLPADQFDRLQYLAERELLNATDQNDTARQRRAHDLLFDVIEPARINTLNAGTVSAV